jgi:protein gp37
MERLLDWVIVGGESGKNARPMHPDWARSLRDQCAAAGVPFFFKQWGEWAPKWSFGDGAGDSGFGDVPEFDGYDRIGKKVAGRLLDGREYNAVPSTR